MSTLPLNKTPVYCLTIPSSKKELKYRPFLVKEEKALLIAYQSEDQSVMVDTLKQIIANCAISPIDIESLATFDIEYIFTQLRAKSVGELVELVFRCDQDTCRNIPEAKAVVSFDISKIDVQMLPEHTNLIKLFDSVSIKMKYPTLNVINNLKTINLSDPEEIFNIIIDCVECIFDDEEVFFVKDLVAGELRTFIEQLTSAQFAKIQQFFETMPKITQQVQYDCPICKHHYDKLIEGLYNFF